MAKAIDTLSIKLEFKDAGTQQIINKLSSSLKGMTRSITGNTSPAISKLRNEIISVGKASTQSISNFRSQRNALAALRDEARVGSATFKRLTDDIKKLDAQMGKSANTARGRRGGARAATQIGGAVVSGGIFGGPEGALGALGGAAFGGVEGAFAGAAAGAVVGGFRQTLGDTAAYAASIDKLKIALEGVSPTTADYNSALATAAQVTRELNVPQEAAVAGITRLTAAVVGANGPVADAETTFKNVTAAIKATGGNSEDVQGAITAMVQVFSKGKVSAEELSGQLGERLPGAVTLFAKANNMSLQELQENLKKGTVGLNELMAFVRQLGVEYGSTAQEISASGAEAGARLTVAVNDLRISVGDALKEVGAGFQVGFEEFITEITPAATKAARELGKALKTIGPIAITVGKNLDTVAVALTGALGAAGIAAIIAKIIEAGSVTKALNAAVIALNSSMLLNPIFLAAVGGAIAVGGIYALTKAISEQADEVERLNRANQLSDKIENRSYSQGGQQVAKDLKQALSIRGAANTELNVLAPQIKELREQVAAEGEDSVASYDLRDLVEKQQTLLKTRSTMDERIRKLKPLLATPKELGQDTKTYEDPSAGGGAGDEDKSLARRISQAQKLEARQVARLNLAQAEGKISSLLAKQLNERTQLEARIAEIKKKGTTAEIDRATSAARTALETKQQLEQQKALDALYKKAVQPLRAAVKAVKEKVQFDNRYKELLKQGINPERAKAIISIEKAFNKTVEVLDVEIDILKAKVAQGDATKQQIALLDELIRKRKEAEGEKQEGVDATEGVGKQPTFMEGLDEAINAQKKSLEELISPLNQVKELSNALGESFKSSFKGLIDGTMSGREALANFFQGVADHFANMAAEIAAEALKLAAMQFIKFIIGGFSNGGTFGSGAGTTPPTTLPGSVGAIAANGLAIGKNGIVPYAKGGIVNKPTLFQYASGGSGRFGLMGEAGPEAIMPLRRGRNGKLGVEASGGTSNVVVNVDASGSSVEGDSNQASQLGKMLGAAVQAELVKQKRPGGLLA